MRIITPEKFYETLHIKKPGKEYLNLIEQAREQDIDELEFTEIHHIHPRSLGGDDTFSNKIQLTVYQHCLAHLYLAMCFPYPEAFLPINLMSGHQYRDLTELERISLEEVYGWSEIRKELHQSLRGKICVIHDPESGQIRRVLKEDLAEWTGLGYVLGVPEERKQINRTLNLGRITISHPVYQTNRMVRNEDVQSWLEQGWVLGRNKVVLSSFKGKVPIHNPITDKEKHVQPEELQNWLDRGWIRGTSMRMRLNHGKTMKGKVRVHRGDESIMVPKEKFQEYLENGWEKGRADWYKTKIANRRVIFKGEEVRKVSAGDAERMVLEEGWKYGWPEGHTKKVIQPGDRLWVHKGDEVVKIWFTELDGYISDGWLRGTGKTKSSETKVKLSQINKNRVTLKKSEVVRRVPLEEAKKLLAEGWEIRGKKSRALLERVDNDGN